MAFDWLSLIPPVVGAVAGASNKGNTTTQTNNALDPRMARIVYGDSGTGGLLGDASSIYQQQMAQGGMNDMQRRGLDMQAQYLQSPQYTNSYQAMMNQGMGLLNSPIAGNPFTQGRGGAQRPAMSSGGYQYMPSPVSLPTYRPQQQVPSAPSAAGGNAGPNPGGGSGSGGASIGRGGSGLSTPGGQGINNEAGRAALAAMAASENPALRAFSPILAGLLGFGGSALAGQQADAMGDAGNHLAASQPLANLGIGTVSDEDGNVRTFSSPESIAAADRATFGNQGGGYSQSGRTFGGFGNGSFGEGNY